MNFNLYSGEVSTVEEDLGTRQVVDWGVELVEAPKAWRETRGAGVKVAILDTGIDPTHPDIAPNFIRGVNFTSDDRGDFTDRVGHGTHCAGIIAGCDNSIGVVGVAPQAQIYAAKVLDDNGVGSFLPIIQGIDWAILQGVDVISISLGAENDPGIAFRDAFKRARKAGITIVCASGNESSAVGYPARYEECIAVGAVDPLKSHPLFSNTGDELDVSAPGVDILSTFLNHGYARLTGTSMATPMVAGVIALLIAHAKAEGETLTSDHITKAIKEKALVLGDKKEFGAGLVDIVKLLNM